MADFTNLGDLIRRDRDLDKIAIIDLGGEAGPREFSYARLDAMANGVARAPAGARPCARRAGRHPLRQSGGISRRLLRHHARRPRGGAGQLQVSAPDHPFHHRGIAGAKLSSAMPRAAPIVRTRLPAVVFGSDGGDGFERFLDPGPFDAIVPRADEPAMFLYTSGSTGIAERRRAFASKPYLGGGDAARGPRPGAPPLSDRGAALSHECAGAQQARLRGARHHRAAAAIQRARLYRGDRSAIAAPGSPRCRR